MVLKLRKRNIKKLKVVYSKEPAITPFEVSDNDEVVSKRQTPGSNAIVAAPGGAIFIVNASEEWVVWVDGN